MVPFDGQISIFILVVLEHFSLALIVFKQIRDLENVGQGNDVQHSSDAIRLQILLDGNSNVCIFRALLVKNSHLKSVTVKI